MRTPSLNLAAWSATVALLITAFGLPFWVSNTASSPGVGDWGDYIGGFAGTIALIWLVVGHYQNQQEIKATKRDVAEQAELTRELVGTLTRIASATQVQGATSLVAAQPVFKHDGTVSIGGTGGHAPTRPTSVRITFTNEGATVRIASVKSLDGTEVRLENPGAYHKGDRFVVIVSSQENLKNVGEIRFQLEFIDQLERAGHSVVTLKRFDGPPDIATEMGQSE